MPPGARGAALVARAQLALSRDRAAAESWAGQGLALCRAAADEFWTAAALNLLAEIALHTGRTDEATARAGEALSIAQAAGDGWNEGYALGTRAAIAGQLGRLRETQELAAASIDVMRGIDQQWGAARALLGLGDLARLRGDPGDAHAKYLEALDILREIDARPEIARCLAGLGRVAIELDELGLARQHLAESLRLCRSTGSRIGMARGLEAFAALAAGEKRPEQAVRLAAAATALRETAGLPALSGARVERYLAAARRLGEPAIARLWAQGLALPAEAAVALALGEPGPQETIGGRATIAVTAGADYGLAIAPHGTLTAREREVAALVADGHSNKGIADELVISPATAARHVTNILAKLGFSSRTQIAAWAADQRARSRRPTRPRRSPGPDPAAGHLIPTTRPAPLLRPGRLPPGTAGLGRLGDAPVQLGPAIAVHVAQRADVLAEGVVETAPGRDRDGPGARGGHGERPSVGVDDDRAGDPVGTAFGARPVAYRDEHPVDGRVGLRLHDLCWPLAVRVRHRRPVDRGAQQLGTVQRRQPHPFGKLKVIADHHADPAEPGRYHGRGRVTGREPEPFPVPQVRLAVDAAKRAVVDQRGAVVHLAGRALAEAAHDDESVLGGQPPPQRSPSRRRASPRTRWPRPGSRRRSRWRPARAARPRGRPARRRASRPRRSARGWPPGRPAPGRAGSRLRRWRSWHRSPCHPACGTRTLPARSDCDRSAEAGRHASALNPGRAWLPAAGASA